MHLARDAVDAEAVRAVRRDLELDHVAPERHEVAERRAGRRGVGEHEDPAVVAAECELVLSEDHAVALDAAQLRHPACGRPRAAPGRATATVWPAATLGAPQTIVAGSPRRRRRGRRAAGRRRGAAGREDEADDVVPRDWDAVGETALVLGAGERQAGGERRRVERRIAIGPQPASRDEHQCAPNCLRKRTSLSK
jgi:hypothetical protein